jgi:hypothetical protein
MEILKLAEDVQNGNCDPIQAYVTLKEIESELKLALAMVQPLAISEADKYPGKQIDLANAVIEKRSAAGQWKYDHIQAWKNAKQNLDYVQKIAQAGGGISPEGEVIDKAVKIEGAATIAVTLKKQEA